LYGINVLTWREFDTELAMECFYLWVHGDSRVQAVGAKEEWIDLHAAVFRPPGRAMLDILDNSLPHLAPKGRKILSLVTLASPIPVLGW